MTVRAEAKTALIAEAIVGGNALRPHMRKAILDAGRPLNSVEVVRALNERGIRVAGQDQVVNVGTALWRARDEFVHLKPQGYWPRDVAYAQAGHDPATYGSHDSDENDESDARDEQTSPSNGVSSASLGIN